jgi:S-adenosylmethionine hydrolase
VSRHTRITLLTDFGTADGYVGAMKAVIASSAPDVIIDDIAHDITPGDVRAASWALGAYWSRYPAGTVHVVVVDPGVGSARRAIAARIDEQFIVAPDNGTVTFALEEARDVAIREIDNTASDICATFHGRDVFAPAAARIAAGTPFETIGPAVIDPIVITFPQPIRTDAGITGAVIHIDRFGNLITNIPPSMIEGHTTVNVNGLPIPIRRTYADATIGDPLALVGSRDRMEISVRDGNAARLLEAAVGDTVEFVAAP